MNRRTAKAKAAPAAKADLYRKVYALYQAIETARRGVRADVPRETGGEERYQFTDYNRGKAIAIGRNLQRSNSKALTLLNNRAVLEFGTVKARFASSDPEWNRQADEFFNVDFARDCRYDEEEHFIEVVQDLERSLMREGDVLVSFDDWMVDSGKLLIWEADQLADIAESEWSTAKLPGWCSGCTQQHGLVLTPSGITAGYVVCRRSLAEEKAGSFTIPLKDATLIPAENARLLKNRFRFNQKRGVPSLLPVSDNLADIDEMLKSELATARMRSKLYAYVKHNLQDELSARDQQVFSEVIEEFEEAARNNTDGTDSTAETKVLPTYEKVDSFTGGCTDYVQPGDEPVFPAIDRPNLDTSAFFDHLGDLAGASQGLSQGYTKMKVDASYTAHRGETALTFAHLHNYRKRMEHQFLDWCGEKVILRAVRKGFIPAPKDPRWSYKINWEFPPQDAIDPQKQAAANAQLLKNGELTFREMLGPGWRDRLAALAEELKFIKEQGLPLNIFETVAGATVNTEE